MYAGKSKEKAMRWAKANADMTRVPWIVFQYPAGFYRIERDTGRPFEAPHEIVNPDEGTDDDA
jgi:hypothetical protein